MDENRAREGFKQLGLPVEDGCLSQLTIFQDFLLTENEKMNLTAITAPDEVLVKHFLDSATPLLLSGVFPAGASVLDVGCGAGFPSMVLKLMRPDLQMTLLDSLQKRIGFLERAVELLQLCDVRCLHARAEEAGHLPPLRGAFDAVVTRAVARMNVLAEYCLPFVRVGGSFVALKGPDIAEELREAERAIAVLGGEVVEVRSVSLPFSDITHTLVQIKKSSENPPKYPRSPAKIKKSPL